jgi:hypothetical protein
MVSSGKYSSALGNALVLAGDVWHWQVLRLLGCIAYTRYYVTFGAKGWRKTTCARACEVPAGVVLFRGDKWHIMSTMYEQKRP